MKLLLTALVLGMAAFAVAGEDVRVASMPVKERLQTMELINVTADKPIDVNAPAPEGEVARILEAVAELEALDEVAPTSDK